MTFCVANLRRNGIFVLPTYVGMTFCVANLRRNGIFVLPTSVGMAFFVANLHVMCMFLVYIGMTFVYCKLTKEWHLGVANLIGMIYICHQRIQEWHLCVANLHRNGVCMWLPYVGMAFVCCQLNTGVSVCSPGSVLFCSVPRPHGDDDRPVPCLQKKPAVWWQFTRHLHTVTTVIIFSVV
jgi:hypothetical protein